MAQEKDQNVSEISLEETNKLRISLGLKPLAVTSNDEPKKVPETLESGGGGSSESMSVEETNKIRASLGLKLLPVPGTGGPSAGDVPSTTSVDQDAQARKNWVEKYSSEKKVEDEERNKKKIAEANERAERQKKLEGETLGGESGGSTKSWLLNLRQQQKSTKKVVAETKTASSAALDSTDLKGLRVSHKLSEIQGEHGDVVLTLRDSSVLVDDDEEILLESTELNEKRKLKEKLRAKRGLRATSEDEDSDGEYKPKNVLSKYDDVIDGEEIISSGFTLDGSSVLKKAPTRVEPAALTNKVKEALEFDVQALGGVYDDGFITGTLGGDYQEAKPAKFKKPKLKKKKGKLSNQQVSSQKRRRDDDDEIEKDEDSKMTNDVDDDFDLQIALNASRRQAQKRQIKKSRILTDQELAEQIQNEGQDEEPEQHKGGLIISSTSDFLSVIKQQANNSKNAAKSKPRTRRDDESESPEPVIDTEAVIESEFEMPEDHEMPEELDPEQESTSVDASSIAPDEPTLSGGLGDALKLLRSHGVLKRQSESDDQDEQRKSDQREWARKTAKERVRRDLELLKQRERDRVSGKFDKLTQKEREDISAQENRDREIIEAREAQRRFANYKPNVNIEYRDDNGRVLNQKEAYKHLSHQFHGKGPGKGKVEKQLKKDEEAKKMMAQSVFGSSDGTKRTSGAAGVRLQ